MILFSIIQLIVGGLVGWLICIRYIYKFRGGLRSPVGQLIITLSVAVGTFYLYFLVVFLWPSIPGRVIIRSILFTGLTFAMLWQYVLFERLAHTIKVERENGRFLKEVKSDS